MIKLELNVDGEVSNFNLPSGWNEVNVGQYQELMELDTNKLSSTMLFVKMITIFSDIDEELVMQIPSTSFKDIQEALSFTKELIEPKETTPESIMVGEDEYFLKKNFNELTMGETISIEVLLEKYDNKLERGLPELLCIFLRKKKENGKLESFKNEFMDRAESFKSIMIEEINDLFIFFSNGVK